MDRRVECYYATTLSGELSKTEIARTPGVSRCQSQSKTGPSG